MEACAQARERENHDLLSLCKQRTTRNRDDKRSTTSKLAPTQACGEREGIGSFVYRNLRGGGRSWEIGGSCVQREDVDGDVDDKCGVAPRDVDGYAVNKCCVESKKYDRKFGTLDFVVRGAISWTKKSKMLRVSRIGFIVPGRV